MKIRSREFTLFTVKCRLWVTFTCLGAKKNNRNGASSHTCGDDSALVLCSALVSTGRLRCHLQPIRLSRGSRACGQKVFFMSLSIVPRWWKRYQTSCCTRRVRQIDRRSSTQQQDQYLLQCETEHEEQSQSPPEWPPAGCWCLFLSEADSLKAWHLLSSQKWKVHHWSCSPPRFMLSMLFHTCHRDLSQKMAFVTSFRQSQLWISFKKIFGVSVRLRSSVQHAFFYFEVNAALFPVSRSHFLTTWLWQISSQSRLARTDGCFHSCSPSQPAATHSFSMV